MVGTGMCFIPLNTLAYAFLPKEQNNYATGLYNLLRNEGGSVGTSMAITLLARRQQFHLDRLGAHLNILSRNTMDVWHSLTHHFQSITSSLKDAQMMAWAQIEQMLQRQAQALSYYDIFWFFSLLVFALLPLVWFMKPARAER
jgi:DHA2 family multidrug resistance protein